MAMKDLGTVLRNLLKPNDSSSYEPLPNDSACPRCDQLLLDHPAVVKRLEEQGIVGGVPGCKCVPPEEEERRLREGKLRRAGLWKDNPAKICTFENFEAVAGTAEGLRAATAFCDGTGPSLLTLAGMTGCGKSHLLEAIGRALIKRRTGVLYALAPMLLDDLRAGYDFSRTVEPEDPGALTYTQLMTRVNMAPVLLLDDIGMQKQTEWAAEKLTAIVDERWRTGKRLAVATNKTYGELQDSLSYRLASRIFDEYSGSTLAVLFDRARDYRIWGGK